MFVVQAEGCPAVPSIWQLEVSDSPLDFDRDGNKLISLPAMNACGGEELLLTLALSI
jgi:hypothetical protein